MTGDPCCSLCDDPPRCELDFEDDVCLAVLRPDGRCPRYEHGGAIVGDVMAVELADGRRYTGTVTAASDGLVTVATAPVPAFTCGLDGEQAPS